MNEERKDLVLRDEGELVPAPELSPDLRGAPLQIWSSIDIKEPAGALQIAALMGADEVSLWDSIGVKIPVMNLLCKIVEEMDRDDGELVQKQRLCLITPEGEVFATNSQWAIRDVLQVCQVLGYPPWDPPRVMIPRKVQTRSGNTCLRLSLELGAIGNGKAQKRT